MRKWAFVFLFFGITASVLSFFGLIRLIRDRTLSSSQEIQLSENFLDQAREIQKKAKRFAAEKAIRNLRVFEKLNLGGLESCYNLIGDVERAIFEAKCYGVDVSDLEVGLKELEDKAEEQAVKNDKRKKRAGDSSFRKI